MAGMAQMAGQPASTLRSAAAKEHCVKWTMWNLEGRGTRVWVGLGGRGTQGRAGREGDEVGRAGREGDEGG